MPTIPTPNRINRPLLQAHTHTPIHVLLPPHTKMSGLSGICQISQGDTQLAAFNNTTVVTVAAGPTWKLSSVNENPPTFTIALVSDPPSSPPKVLTLGEKVEEEGIQIFVSPLQSPPSKRQQWTLEDVLPTKRWVTLMCSCSAKKCLW